MAGFNAAVSVGETPVGGKNKPVSFAANYSAGPLFVGAGYLNPENSNDKLINLGATYNFGFAKLAFGYAKGTLSTLDVNGDKKDTRGMLVAATIPFGATDIKVGYGQDKVGQTDGSDSHINKLGVGAHYNLSKRTKVYVDYAHATGTGVNAGANALVLGPKSAYDLGIFHSF
jgi:predicted porin